MVLLQFSVNYVIRNVSSKGIGIFPSHLGTPASILTSGDASMSTSGGASVGKLSPSLRFLEKAWVVV